MENAEERDVTMPSRSPVLSRNAHDSLVKWLLGRSLLMIFSNVAILMRSRNFREMSYATLVSSHLAGFDVRI